MNLDDLGQAAVEAVRKYEPEPNSTCDEDVAICRIGALAAVELFAEELSRMECHYCESGDLLSENKHGAFWHSRGHICGASHIRRLIASLRAEAGQGQAKKGSE